MSNSNLIRMDSNPDRGATRPSKSGAVANANGSHGGTAPPSIPEEGIPISRLRGEPTVSIDDLVQARAALEESFEPFGDMTWDILVAEVHDREWTRDQLLQAIRHVITSKRWVNRGDRLPRITPADILAAPTALLYPRSWYEALTPDQRRRVRIYDVPGHGILYGEEGTKVDYPEVDLRQRRQEMLERERKALAPPGPEPVQKRTLGWLDLNKKLLAAEAEAEELRTSTGRLRRRIETLERQLDELRVRRPAERGSIPRRIATAAAIESQIQRDKQKREQDGV